MLSAVSGMVRAHKVASDRILLCGLQCVISIAIGIMPRGASH
jgi:hypothetical protein